MKFCSIRLKNALGPRTEVSETEIALYTYQTPRNDCTHEKQLDLKTTSLDDTFFQGHRKDEI